uniref:Uncharacterized protein n=1 Tax=Parastrongyloides trichosuri TaxID=131310 RepID=A0A0N4Z357_PARTI
MSNFNRRATIPLFLLFSILLFTLSNAFVLQELPLYREERNLKEIQMDYDAVKRGIGSGRIHPYSSMFFFPRKIQQKYGYTSDKDVDEGV